MTTIEFDDKTLVPRPSPLDIPIEPLLSNKDLPTAMAGFIDGVMLLERMALQSKIVEMGRVSADHWKTVIHDLCGKYFRGATAMEVPIATEVIHHLEAMVRGSEYSDMVLHTFDRLRPRLLSEIRLQLA